jgi:thymidylate synthase
LNNHHGHYLGHSVQDKVESGKEKEQLTREPRSLPTMKLNPEIKELWDFKYEDFQISNYNPHPHIKMEISV